MFQDPTLQTLRLASKSSHLRGLRFAILRTAFFTLIRTEGKEVEDA